MDKRILIEKFIKQISEKYPSVYIDYEYDIEEDEYTIWHNDSELEFNNDSFSKFVGERAEELLFKNNIFNFSIGYDYDKALEISNKKIAFSINNENLGEIFVEYIECFIESINERTFTQNIGHKFDNDSIDIIKVSSTSESSSDEKYTVSNDGKIDIDNFNNIFGMSTILEEVA